MLSRLFSRRTIDTGSDISNVYVLRTHVLNSYVKKIFNQMQEQMGKERVFLLFDETNGAPNEPYTKWNEEAGVVVGPAIITINESDCQKINQLHNAGNLKGSMFKVEAHVYACYKAIRCSFDYLWFIEYDVYSNDFNAALKPFDKIKADMLTRGTDYRYFRWIRTALTNRSWYWWNKLEGAISEVPTRRRRGCFFPVNRFSKKFLEVLEQNLSKSSGYCEVYFPTLCYINGLVLKSMKLSAFGSFRYRPSLSSEEIRSIKPQDHRLYHPVKDM